MSADAPSTSARWESSRHLPAYPHVGDTSALGRLLGRHLARLRRWAHGRLPRRAGTGVDTSDLLQDAALRTIPKIGELRSRSERALGTFLRRVVHNRIRDEHRRIGRRGAPEELSDGVIDNRPSPLDGLLLEESEARYRRALAALHPRDRELIVGHVELDYSHEQLGRMTGRTAHAARMALQRAISRLAERMRDA